MDQNKEIIIPEIRIPELPDEPAPVKKKSKLPLVIILSVLGALIVAAAVLAAVLLMPVMRNDHWGNTANAVFFDAGELNAFSEALAGGAKTELSLEIDPELTGLLKAVNFEMTAASKLSENNEKGSLTLSVGGGSNSLALSIIYDEDTAALGIYSIYAGKPKGDISYVSFPRKGITEEFRSSVFAPDSGSDFALEQEIFDEIVSALEAFEKADNGSNAESIETSMLKISERVSEIIVPKVSLGFADSGFALTKEISFIMTADDIRAVIDVIIEEAEANDDLYALLNPSYSTAELEDASLLEALKEAKAELPDGEVIFSYTVSGDYVHNMRYAYTAPEGSDESFDAALEFVYGDSAGFDILVTYDNGDEDDKVTYRKENSADEHKVSLKIESEGEIFEASVIRNTADESLLITASASDSPESLFELRGTCKYDPEAAFLSLSFSSIKVGQADAIDGFSVEMSIGKHEEDIVIPESTSLFKMTDAEFKKYVEGMPTDTLEKIVESVTGKDFESFFSADGQLMLNSAQYAELATAYANAYSVYLANTEVMRADAVYIPVPELGINVLLYYNQRQNMIYYNFAYNMIPELLASYHPASFDDKGNMTAHNVVTTTTPATCMNMGKTVHRCTLCGESETETTRALGHSIEWLSVEALCDDGKVYTVRYNKCRNCGLVESFGIGDGISISYNLTMNEATGVHTVFMTSSTSREGICRYFGLPTVLEDIITVGDFRQELDVSGKYVIRLPKGLETLSGNRLKYSDEMQILIIPSTLKSISSAAFSSYKNLHTVFYCGTEEEWKQVSFDMFKSLGDRVKVVFCPNGVTPDLIADALVDPAKIENAVSTAKKSFTSGNSAAKKLDALDGISLVHSSKIKGTAYCKSTNSVAVFSEYNGKSTTVTVYDLGTMKKTVTLTVSGEINTLDMADGYIAYGLANSAKTLYLYSIADNTTKELAVPLLFEFSRDQLAFVMIDCGKVYTTSNEQHCNFVYYSIAEDKFVTVNQVYKGLITIDREAHLITLETYTSPQSIYYYDTENGVLLDGPGSAYKDPFVAVNAEYRMVEQLSILLGRQGSAKLVVSPEYKTLVAMKNASSDSVRYVECYAESAIVTRDGDFLLYTPGGYGLLLIDMN